MTAQAGADRRELGGAVLDELKAERRLHVLELRAEREGYVTYVLPQRDWTRILTVTHQADLRVGYEYMAGYFGAGPLTTLSDRTTYFLTGMLGTQPLTRDEAVELLTEVER